MPGTEYLAKLITVRYLIALILTGLFVTMSTFLIVGRAANIEREGYRVVGLASEQRAASQRISFLANAYVEETDPEMRWTYRSALSAAIAGMAERHEILSLQDGSVRVPEGMRSILSDLYQSESRLLDLQVDRFLDHAQALLDAPEGDPDLPVPQLLALDLAGIYLSNTHGLIARLLRQEAIAAVDRIYSLEKVLWALMLALLAVQVPLIFRPMTRQASQILERMRLARLNAEEEAAAAKAAREGQASFIRTMSHELRTPLNAILGMNQLLRMSDLYGKQREYTEDIDQAGRHLLGLIDDILEFSRLEAKQVEIRKMRTSIGSELESVVNLLKPLAAGKRLQLGYCLDRRLAEFYWADGLRIRQVLVNIISNGIKFTNEGSVTVRAVFVRTLESGTDIVRFEVRDTGIGVPPEARERIFQEFQQVDNSLTRRYGGSGLGLAICSRLVALMSGELSVENPVGGGSAFWFTLPLERILVAPAGDEETEAAAFPVERERGTLLSRTRAARTETS